MPIPLLGGVRGGSCFAWLWIVVLVVALTCPAHAGESPARRIKIIPLEKANATRVQEALDKILERGSSRRQR